MSQNLSSLSKQISDRTAVICIIGLGHVGLPEALLFAECGFKVIGFDTDAKKVDAINSGESHLADVNDDKLKELLSKGLFRADDSPSVLESADVAIIAVPTLLTRQKNPEIHSVMKAAKSLSNNIGRPTLVILESTGPPGVTEEVVQATLEGQGLELDRDYFLSCSPARIDPGNKEWPLQKIPKIVGGLTQASGDLAESLYRQVMKTVIRASSVKAAEMTKLLENSFRAVNISFVDQLHMICHTMGLDVWEILDLAKTKPFGFVPFYPGPGPGGDCIPVDPFYVAWKAREFEYHARFIELAGEIMDTIPGFFFRCLTNLLSDSGKPLKGSKILIIGVAYKKNVGDVSNSPAHSLVHLLEDREVDFTYYDPFVPKFKTDGTILHSTQLTAEQLQEQDAVIIMTDHSNIDYDLIVDNSKLILDSRNALAGYKNRSNIFR